MTFQLAHARELLTRTLNQTGDPTELRKELRLNARALGIDALDNDPNIFEKIAGYAISLIQQGDANDPLYILFHNFIINKDAEVNASWADNSLPNSIERRAKLWNALELDETLSSQLDAHFPPFLNGHILIADNHIPWLTPERKENDGYYGPSVLHYQRKVRGMAEESVVAIDQAGDQILDYLSDPRGINAYSSRGLVVGYVQSGKTTNINVLIAKAIDSGYRLIIIFAGLTDVLRTQTQRRVDKEVVGKVLIESDEEEKNGAGGYRLDPDWADFIEHTPKPGRLPGPKIERMTTKAFDFSKGRGVAIFTDDWVNSGTSARIIVVKKQANRLKNLVRELNRLSTASHGALPVLLIDDESDQASINTYRPDKLDNEGKKARKAINREIVKLLKLLPRCQYIGYTATPFANVFINPDDAEDLFPKDFVYALNPPPDYMGIKDFHDLDDEFLAIENIADADSNTKKRVRDILKSIKEKDDSEQKLRHAVDAFVVAGAIKLYRSEVGRVRELKSRHHTMFYTDSTKRADHDLAMVQIQSIWDTASYNSKIGVARLKDIYQDDFVENSKYKNFEKYFPADFEALRPFINQAIQKINEPFNEHSTILVVNSDNADMSPDFDRHEIWKIVIGGSKLSRGYTIEGLTITYFRRKSASQATLLQMGRWFGYRGGYDDLVRLYISRNEKHGREYMDLYKAFEAICQDEHAFREELRRYAVPNADGTRLTPKDIPPLVQNTHPMLKPDHPNKMWNARLTSRNFGGKMTSSTVKSIDKRVLGHNAQLFKSLFEQFVPQVKNLNNQGRGAFYICEVPNVKMLEVLKDYDYIESTPKQKLLDDFLKNRGNGIDSWLVALPQLVEDSLFWKIDPSLRLKTVERTWNPKTKQFATTGEDRHRLPCYKIIKTKARDPQMDSPDLDEYIDRSNLAVLLTYPILPRNLLEFPISDKTPAIGFEFFLPKSTLPLVGYEVMRPDRPNDVVVDVVPTG